MGFYQLYDILVAIENELRRSELPYGYVLTGQAFPDLLAFGRDQSIPRYFAKIFAADLSCPLLFFVPLAAYSAQIVVAAVCLYCGALLPVFFDPFWNFHITNIGNIKIKRFCIIEVFKSAKKRSTYYPKLAELRFKSER
jgi:hypothetical protein